MKQYGIILVICVFLAGCYALGKQFPLWDVRQIDRPRVVTPERVRELELRAYTDIWTQC